MKRCCNMYSIWNTAESGQQFQLHLHTLQQHLGATFSNVWSIMDHVLKVQVLQCIGMYRNANTPVAPKKPSENDRAVLSGSRTTMYKLSWYDAIWLHSDATKGFALYRYMSGQYWPTPRQALDLCLPARKKLLCLGLLFWLGLGTQEADWPCCPC